MDWLTEIHNSIRETEYLHGPGCNIEIDVSELMHDYLVLATKCKFEKSAKIITLFGNPVKIIPEIETYAIVVKPNKRGKPVGVIAVFDIENKIRS